MPTVARLSVVCALALAVLAGTGTPHALAGFASGEIDLTPPPGLRSRSLELPWEGQLVRGMLLRESQYVSHVARYAGRGNFYGTWELVQLLERAARRVAFRLPGARLAVGELSRARGGPIDGHRSHQSGRDVDVAFYMTLPDRTPTSTYAFVEFDGAGRGRGPNRYLRFDDARNWELVAKLVADEEARVQFIFVANALQDRLLREAQRVGAPRTLIERARAVMLQPEEGNPHRDHFHVRVYCAPADRPNCRDVSPYWPWYPGTPPGGAFAHPGRPYHVLVP